VGRLFNLGTLPERSSPPFPHQNLGVRTIEYFEDNLGSCLLADDMDCGKTYLITLLLKHRPTKDPTLVLSEKGVLRFYKQILELVGLKVHIHEDRDTKAEFLAYDVVLSTPQRAALEYKRLVALDRGLNWIVRLPNALRPLCYPLGEGLSLTRPISCRIPTEGSHTPLPTSTLNIELFVTGTPLSNDYHSIHALFQLLQLKPFNNLTPFRSVSSFSS
jgi:hypothetical protein